MKITRDLLGWYIRNIIIPSNEVFDIPGFILNRVAESTIKIDLREILLPEEFFQEIENAIIESYADEGKAKLYSAGKKFGYFYSSISSFPVKGQTTKKQFLNFAKFVILYISGLYCNKVDYNINYEENTLEISFKNYVVCRNNGHGYLMKQGAISGVWSWVIKNKHSEAVQLSCQGRNQKECKLICGLPKKINIFGNLISETNLTSANLTEEYTFYNSPKKNQYSLESVSDWINIGKIKQNKGELLFRGSRYFTSDLHILHFIESEISLLKEGTQKLFNISFAFGKKIVKKICEDKSLQFLSDYFSVTGFGDLLIVSKKEKIVATFYNYPYSVYSAENTFVIVRGLLSGMASEVQDKEVKFEKFKVESDGGYNVVIFEC